MADAFDQLVGDLAAPYALLFSVTRSIGTLIPDVVVSENHNDSAVVTQHPVEGGSSMADHIFDNPPTLEMRCGYSDTSGGYPGYVNDAYQAILQLKESKTPFQVVTGSRVYDSMAFTNVNVFKDVDSAYALMFSATLQVVVVTTTDDGQGSADQADPQSTGSSADAGNKSLQPTSGVQGMQGGVGGIQSDDYGQQVQGGVGGLPADGYTVTGVGQDVPLPPPRPTS